MPFATRIPWLPVLWLLLASAVTARAQWLPQTFDLKFGWNAIYLHVDISHSSLDQLIKNAGDVPIEEVWLWTPGPGDVLGVKQPASPSQPSLWAYWRKVPVGGANTLRQLVGNAACLIRTTRDYTWNVVGKPVAPVYRWTTTGLNFIGFPSVTASVPSLDTYLQPAPDLRLTGKFFGYAGGTSIEPVQIDDISVTPATRGRAFWVQASENVFNRYFAPFEIESGGSEGVRLGGTLGQTQIRLRNITRSPLTVTLSRVDSVAPPVALDGGRVYRGQAPILVRGQQSTDLLSPTHEALVLSAGARTWTLQPKGEVGSEVEIVLGVDRGQMTGRQGDLYASLLRFTDSLGYARIDVPASAEVSTRAGLWVGNAVVTAVDQALTEFARATNQTHFAKILADLGRTPGPDGKDAKGYRYEWDQDTGRILVFDGPTASPAKGKYLDVAENKISNARVARPLSMRLIVHHDGVNARLLQRVHSGLGSGGVPILTPYEGLLDPTRKASAKRISAVHLPVPQAQTGGRWEGAGSMEPGNSLVFTVATDFNDASSNPFVHQYHPDHDNLDEFFKQRTADGVESYTVNRKMTLTAELPGADFASRTQASTWWAGLYREVVEMAGESGGKKSYSAGGAFEFHRISENPVLTLPSP